MGKVLVLVDKMKQFVPRKILEFQDDLRDTPVGYIHIVFDAALSAKTESHPRSLHINMSILHGRQTERSVFTSILFVAHTDEAELEQLYNRRQHFVSTQSAPRDIFPHTSQHFSHP